MVHVQPWSLPEVCDIATGALASEATRLDLEQATYGLDAKDELSLHAVLREGFASAQFGVLAEQRYPQSRARRRRSEGERCDIVLTPAPEQALTDPLLDDTLFAGQGVSPRGALWLEVKIARQFALTDGVAGPSPWYTTQLLTAATADVRKLVRESGVNFACLLLVLFTRDAATAKYDLDVWLSRCLDHNLPIEAPIIGRFAIADRLGNESCTVSLTRIKPARRHD